MMRRILLVLLICFVWVSPVQAVPVAGYSVQAILGPVQTFGVDGIWYDDRPPLDAFPNYQFNAGGLYTIMGGRYWDESNPEGGYGAPPPAIAQATVYNPAGYASGFSYIDRSSAIVSTSGEVQGTNVNSSSGISSATSINFFVANSEGDVTFTAPYTLSIYSWSNTNGSRVSAGAEIQMGDEGRGFGQFPPWGNSISGINGIGYDRITYTGTLSFTEHLMAGEIYEFHKGVFAAGNAVNVPEPATVILFGAGLLGLIGFRRKFKK